VKKSLENVWKIQIFSLLLQPEIKNSNDMKYLKIYQGFKPKADMILNYQLCRAYFGENGGVYDMVEKILSSKFGGLHAKDKAIIRELRGKHNPVIELPYHEFKATVEEILEGFVELRFDKMVLEVLSRKEGYPLKFRDIVEKYNV
jgi:hypothetical protein